VEAGDESPHEAWAAERADINMGQALARLLFSKGDRSDDPLIERLLTEALVLREKLGLDPKVADALSALGALQQEQAKLLVAEEHYLRALHLRRQLRREEEAQGRAEGARDLDRALGQSFMSLGNLVLEMAELARSDQPEQPETGGNNGEGGAHAGAHPDARPPVARDHLEIALGWMREARDAYVKGFSPSHPKVAWALEGMSNVFRLQGDESAAAKSLGQAIRIREALQATAKGRLLFADALRRDQCELAALLHSIAAKRLEHQRMWRKGALVASSWKG